MLSVQKLNISAKSFYPPHVCSHRYKIYRTYSECANRVSLPADEKKMKENLFQLMAVTAMGYLAAWGPFCVLCLWEMIVMPQVKMIYI